MSAEVKTLATYALSISRFYYKQIPHLQRFDPTLITMVLRLKIKKTHGVKW